ncbi:MAG: Elongation factor 4 [Planctomycetes bacterium ADurb.Bin126]|nr:MAG: Elongation factor 4 [Planctomycetes bacterium ADurb.Bin126]HOD83340.1 translation elongation factor 4 [Phycisphaerae bacterium]HQL75139.1 translation elongation factor 4 [Phycisphaerae bacterium]
MDQKYIRNFSIIAHIDHGKSTLADRVLLTSGAITLREFRDQLLDDMDLERERGITIKASAVTVEYKLDGRTYMLNMIDTPGHVDFHYEVSRALAACDGALLVVDAAQGVEAQTVANAHLARKSKLDLVPVVNKIDLPAARPEDTAMEVEALMHTPAEDCIFTSAKTGAGIDDMMRAVIERLPAPRGNPDAHTKALIFDSKYDDYRGVVVYIRVFDGRVNVGDKIRMMGTQEVYQVTELGKFMPRAVQADSLSAGEVGFLIANIRTVKSVHVGDTITLFGKEAPDPLPGYRPPQQMVFCDLYPGPTTQFPELRDALEKVQLNDAALTFQPINSDALGFGFRCGFLGMLHMEIVQERAEREHGVEVVQTAPTVPYQVLKKDGKVIEVDSAGDLPDPNYVEEIREPIVRVDLIVPTDSIGPVMQLAEERRASYQHQEHLSADRVILTYEFPLAEIIYDFYDKLKSATRGYGTMDYEMIGFRADSLVKLDILVNNNKVDALSVIVHRDTAERRGRRLIQRLRKEISRHLFEIPLQAAIGSKVIARETIKAVGKNVTAKCYGGDITRKRKLLEKQKEGKKRMKMVGNVEIPQKAFMAVLEVGGDEE